MALPATLFHRLSVADTAGAWTEGGREAVTEGWVVPHTREEDERLTYLDPDVDRELARAAGEAGVTTAEYIRRALRAAVESRSRPTITAMGVGEGPGDVADDADRHLRETGFGDS